MPLLAPHSIDDRLYVLRTRWELYIAEGRFEQFIEFAVTVNSLVEYFNQLHLPGLVRLCEGLENTALSKLGDPHTHPIDAQAILALQRQMDAMLGSVANARPRPTQRLTDVAGAEKQPIEDWIKPRTAWMIVAPQKSELTHALRLQLQFFGIKILELGWEDECPPALPEALPLAVLFFPDQAHTSPQEFSRIAQIRALCPASQLIYLGLQSDIVMIVELMRAGIDLTIQNHGHASTVLNCLLDLIKTNEQEKYRVLIVEDSRVAVAVIQRTLHQHGMETYAISDPGNLIEVLESYRPDLILMDIYMPRFNGIEATRVLRQMPAYQALPIVYLSGETTVGMQVEALRLGGDQFLIKPFNPVLLAAVAKAKIERYREAQRSSQLDGLTGLLNHTAAKSRLQAMVGKMVTPGSLIVAMIDIDHFKAINDTYGHPVGDQVIRGLAWLLRGRLRATDLVGRYGGEEFLIALNNVTAEQALSVLNRIREGFAALPHTHPNGDLYATFSAGIASYPAIDTAASLTQAADGALLQAKRLGRNRVELSL